MIDWKLLLELFSSMSWLVAAAVIFYFILLFVYLTLDGILYGAILTWMQARCGFKPDTRTLIKIVTILILFRQNSWRRIFGNDVYNKAVEIGGVIYQPPFKISFSKVKQNADTTDQT